MQAQRRAAHQGIEVRHRKACPAKDGRRCACRPSYQAQVWSARDRTPIRKTFPTLQAARAWRSDAQAAIRRGAMGAPTKVTVREAAEAFVAGIKVGTVRTRTGDPYKPSVIRSYEGALTARLVTEFGSQRLSALTRRHLQDYADRLLAEGLDPSTVRNTLIPLRAIYRRAVSRGEVALNPTKELELPAPRGRRERIATPAEAQALLEALPERDRALWATALYAGLRRGELQALRWSDVDLERNRIRVERSWDRKEGAIEVKSRAGRRTVPVAGVLRRCLVEHQLRSASGEGLVFATATGRVVDPATVVERARKAWGEAGLEPIAFHECRHTFASLMIAAGVNAKALSAYLGHASIAITLDRYGHLMPGSEDEAADRLERYLEQAAS